VFGGIGASRGKLPLAGSLYRSEYAPVGGSGGAFITPMVYVTIIRLPAMQMEISFRWWRERNPKDYEIKKAGNKPTFTGILRDDWPTICANALLLIRTTHLMNSLTSTSDLLISAQRPTLSSLFGLMVRLLTLALRARAIRST